MIFSYDLNIVITQKQYLIEIIPYSTNKASDYIKVKYNF